MDRYYGYGLVDADEAAPNLVPDTTPPVISSVAASTTATTATITWVTDEPATSVVNYGTTTALGSTVTDTTLTTTHSVTLTGLSPETAYYFEVQSADAAGNLTTDNNGGLFYSFTTPAAPANSVSIADITMSTTTYKRAVLLYLRHSTRNSSGSGRQPGHRSYGLRPLERPDGRPGHGRHQHPRSGGPDLGYRPECGRDVHLHRGRRYA
ncbi:MAG: fibronectin type III domain-containing protein [Bacillota bacterium]